MLLLTEHRSVALRGRESNGHRYRRSRSNGFAFEGRHENIFIRQGNVIIDRKWLTARIDHLIYESLCSLSGSSPKSKFIWRNEDRRTIHDKGFPFTGGDEQTQKDSATNRASHLSPGRVPIQDAGADRFVNFVFKNENPPLGVEKI